jgi:hypothetical protein
LQNQFQCLCGFYFYLCNCAKNERILEASLKISTFFFLHIGGDWKSMEAYGEDATWDYKGGKDRRTLSQMESYVCERLLIMENLSQLYLNGLEEVCNNVFNIKFICLIILSSHAFCSLSSNSCISSCVGLC